MNKKSSGTTGFVLFSVLSVLHVLMACSHEKAGTGPAPPDLEATFSSIQANIFTPKCFNRGCHPGRGSPFSLKAGVSYNNLVNVPSAYGLPRVDPFNSINSALYLKVIGDNRTGGPNAQMPLTGPKLSSDEVEAIRDWIDAGAENN